MRPSSNQDTYTVPSTMNIGINVTTQYFDPKGELQPEKTDHFQVLFFKDSANVKPLNTILDRWCRDGSIYEVVSLEGENRKDIVSGIRGFETEEELAYNNNGDVTKIIPSLIKNGDFGKSPEFDQTKPVLSSLYNGDQMKGFSLPLKKIRTNSTIMKEEKDNSIRLDENNNNFNTKLSLSPDIAFKYPIILKSEINRTIGYSTRIPFHKTVSLKLSGNSIDLNNESDNLSFSENIPKSSIELKNKSNTPIQNPCIKIKPIKCITSDPASITHNEIDNKDNNISNINLSSKINKIDRIQSHVEESSNLNESNRQHKDKPNSTRVNILKVSNNHWQLSRLFNLFEIFYLEGIYQRELINEFNKKEQLIFCKIIKMNPKEILKLIGHANMIALMADKYFCNDTKKKGYKITNNKRFVFRKIRAILYRNIQDSKSEFKGSKNTRDAKFFSYYFQNAPEYSHLTIKERLDVKSLLRTYEESKIGVIWKFKRFTDDFSKVFFNFPQEMMTTYYMKKVCAFKFCLEYMNDKDDDFILKSSVPIKCLPRPLNVIKQYMADFFNSFAEYLRKE